ncbi:MAG: hypothetical protein IT581_22345 [Verrucomicrobiales bacterium]|nr:hypothetical protein [Verrucomicrobiales bacterium]
MGLFGKSHWSVFDCVTGDFVRLEQFPYELGEGPRSDAADRASGTQRVVLSLGKKGELQLARDGGSGSFHLNGIEVEEASLEPGKDYSLQLGSRLLAVRGGKDLSRWQKSLKLDAWTLYDPASGESSAEKRLDQILTLAEQAADDSATTAILQGLDMGFYLHQFRRRRASPHATEPAPVANVAGPQVPQLTTVNSENGRLTCLTCWLRFDPGDIMHVAVHDSLRGDPVLGPDAQQRFQATRFNDRGQARDAFGLPCTEIACPHCRRVLPPGFGKQPHHIFSLVGDQGAGKSYYLCVSTKVLARRLFRRFSIVFQDADPAGNAALNEMKRTLYGAQTPEQAKLVKTQLDGAMYERLPRYGRIVALPRPFVFSVEPEAASASRCSVVFYDNAGEHFQPGRDSSDSPGAQHVSSSRGLLFLFDPFNSHEFRHRMAGRVDPQMETPVIDQQDIILSELRARLQKGIPLEPGAKTKAPLAMLIGKCDAWMNLFGDSAPKDPLLGNQLDLSLIEQNSNRVRSLLMEIYPTIVANAERISETVMYFPVSAFGTAPVKLRDGEYVPDPASLNPILPDIPLLWLLSRVDPTLIPTI